MENDLIRRSDAYNAVFDYVGDYEPPLLESIKDIPAVDAVEVVRCRECQFNPKHEWTGCPKAGTWREFNYDGFCSDGHRREEAGDG